MRASPTAQLKSAVIATIRAIYPPQCIACGALVESDFALCGTCWRDTPFISGARCYGCGISVPADPSADAGASESGVLCEECHQSPRPWTTGRAVMLYEATGRKLVLALKHGDRLDIARPAGLWLSRAAEPLLRPDTLIAPIPMHWWRLLRRRYNQAQLLSSALARATGFAHSPDLLCRIRPTGSQEGRSRDARFAALTGAIEVSARKRPLLAGRHVLLVDDVMTSGATFSAATKACLASGASSVSVLALARVAKTA